MGLSSYAFRMAVVGIAAAVTACSAQYHQQQIAAEPAEKRLTVGTVQQEIRVGMSGAEVAQSLGSPNIVTTDEQRRETWIYDKFATDATYSNSSAYGTILILGASGGSGASTTSQRTLTVVIKFDAERKVRDFAYHSSRF